MIHILLSSSHAANKLQYTVCLEVVQWYLMDVAHEYDQRISYKEG